MKILTLLVCAVSICTATDWIDEDDVLILSDSDFDQAVEEFKILLVEFCEYHYYTH
jgi:hypothetical protein